MKNNPLTEMVEKQSFREKVRCGAACWTCGEDMDFVAGHKINCSSCVRMAKAEAARDEEYDQGSPEDE